MNSKKTLKYYLSLPWSYTVEQEESEGHRYYILRVNELPGVCTDAENLSEGEELIKEAIEAAIKLYMKNGEEIPEPINKIEFKGNIAYRTTSERHYYVAKAAQSMHKWVCCITYFSLTYLLSIFYHRDHREHRGAKRALFLLSLCAL